MKKLLFIVVALVTVFTACKKEEAADISGLEIVFKPASTVEVTFAQNESTNKTVSLNVELNKVAPMDIPIIVSIGSDSDAKEGTQFNLSATELTIPKGQSKINLDVEVLANGRAVGSGAILFIELSSYYANRGENSKIQLNLKWEGVKTIFEEGFEEGAFPDGWQAINVDGKAAHDGSWFNPANTWVVTDNTSAGVHSGSYAAGNNSWVADESGADDWLITSAIELGTDNLLSFFIKSTNSGYPNNCKVYISTSSDQSSFTTSIYENVGVDAADWIEAGVTIPESFEKQTVYIAFRDDSNGDAIVLDDIILTGIK